MSSSVSPVESIYSQDQLLSISQLEREISQKRIELLTAIQSQRDASSSQRTAAKKLVQDLKENLQDLQESLFLLGRGAGSSSENATHLGLISNC